MHAKKNQKIVVLATGGTIAGRANHPTDDTDDTAYTAAQLGVQDLIDAVPTLDQALQGDSLVSEQVAQLDSKDMDHATWQTLAQRCVHWLSQPDVSGIVITHGTDTLEETAWFLQQVLATSKPVVLTCAMRPATSSAADGPQNLRDALVVVREPMAQGVLVVCAGQIHNARHVQKVHPHRLDAFSSGDAGPQGWLEKGHVHWVSASSVSVAHAHDQLALALPVAQWPWVAVLHSHAGAGARQMRALVDAGVQGLVVAGTGNGTVHDNLLSALLEARAQGITVRLTTRCAEGQIVGESAALQTAPLGLNPFKARISLMLDLMA